MSLAAILQSLVEVTPPPVTGEDPAVLIEVAQRICRAREPLLAELARQVNAGAAVEKLETLVGALTEVDGRWQAALSCARDQLNQRARAVSRIRKVTR